MRCFVAIDLPAGARAAIASVQAELRAAADGADVRWVDPAALHLTLKFLGEVLAARVDGVTNALRAAVGGTEPLTLTVGGVGAFPSPRRARVLWVGVAGRDLARLAGAVEGALAAEGFAAEARSWSAHLTVGRVRSPRGLGRLAVAIEGAGHTEIGVWTASEVVLYRSHLRPAGAVYEAVARVPLAGAEA